MRKISKEEAIRLLTKEIEEKFTKEQINRAKKEVTDKKMQECTSAEEIFSAMDEFLERNNLEIKK